MKVVCINDKFVAEVHMNNPPHPLIGDVDEVIDTKERYGDTYYVLERFAYAAAFLVDHFVTLPDQTEEIILKQELTHA